MPSPLAPPPRTKLAMLPSAARLALLIMIHILGFCARSSLASLTIDAPHSGQVKLRTHKAVKGQSFFGPDKYYADTFSSAREDAPLSLISPAPHDRDMGHPGYVPCDELLSGVFPQQSYREPLYESMTEGADITSLPQTTERPRSATGPLFSTCTRLRTSVTPRSQLTTARSTSRSTWAW